MDSNSITQSFFDRSFEKEINDNLFYRNYTFPMNKVLEYINEIVNTPIEHYIEYIISHCSISYIESSDVVQFSSLEAATYGITNRLKMTSDEGCSFVEIGQLLLKEQPTKNEIAYRKYGENHTKTAREFGLVQILYNKTYSSCLGHVFPDLDESIRKRLLRRLMLRNKYFSLIIKISNNGPVSLDSQLGFLSESTKIRRLSNLKKCWGVILEELTEDSDLYQNVTR